MGRERSGTWLFRVAAKLFLFVSERLYDYCDVLCCVVLCCVVFCCVV